MSFTSIKCFFSQSLSFNLLVAVCTVEMNTLDVVNRQGWGAKPPKSVAKINDVVPFVVIHHSFTPKACYTSKKCQAAMRSMQSFHQNDRDWVDIGYK